MKTATSLLSLAAGVLLSSTAQANSDSLFTVGVGTALGVNRSSSLGGDAETSFTSEVSIKFKALHVLGAEFAYAPTASDDEGQPLVFDGAFRASGLLYLVPTYPVTFYLKGGLSSGKITELFDVDAPSVSYHTGAGLDVHIGDNLVMGLEYLLLIPGLNGVKQTFTTYANEEIKRFQRRGVGEEVAAAATPEVSDYISADNFRITVSARWYF